MIATEITIAIMAIENTPTIMAVITGITNIESIDTTTTATGDPGTIGMLTYESIPIFADMEGTIMTAHISCTDFAILMPVPASSFLSADNSEQIGYGWLLPHSHEPPCPELSSFAISVIGVTPQIGK